MFSAAKDRMASNAAKVYLNEKLRNYGRLEELEIDSGQRRVRLICQLDGEPTAVGITVEQYEIERDGAATFLVVGRSSATRPWLQALLRDQLHGRRIELPAWVAGLL